MTEIQQAEEPQKKSGFKFFLAFGFISLIAVLVYFFLQNYEIIIRKKQAPPPTSSSGLISVESPSLQPQLNWEIKILDGNVIAASKTETKILINKNDYEDIEEFTQVFVSPDKEKMCFLGQSIVPLWLFVAQTDGTNITKITTAKNCVWAHNSQKLSFNNHTTDVSPVDVWVYDLKVQQMTNLTESISLKVLDADKGWEVYRFYKEPVWSADDKKITSAYDYLYLDTSGKNGSGESVIDLQGKQVIDQ